MSIDHEDITSQFVVLGLALAGANRLCDLSPKAGRLARSRDNVAAAVADFISFAVDNGVSVAELHGWADKLAGKA